MGLLNRWFDWTAERFGPDSFVGAALAIGIPAFLIIGFAAASGVVIVGAA